MVVARGAFYFVKLDAHIVAIRNRNTEVDPKN